MAGIVKGTACAVLMASGFSMRFGKDDKLLCPFRGKPIASYTLELACGMEEFSEIILVASDDKVAALSSGTRARVVRNGAPHRGVCESIRLGVTASEAEYFCFFPCDQPLMRAYVPRALLAHVAPGAIAEPVCGGIARSPSVFSGSFRDELASIPDGEGGSYVKKRHADAVVSVYFDDEPVFADIDTVNELNRIEGVLPCTP
ncbi:MAG: NTP transferase domain-containing protein [Synergistaceae bacterium]|jgi:molybdenum cofactor cytidylyltransferase|nr:NTP transferase domain-containing protein [Synergistaceae bacterium]